MVLAGVPGARKPAGVSYTEGDAQAALAAFAFARDTGEVRWNEPSWGGPFGPPPTAVQAYRWAYHSYDCVPADPGDLTVAEALLTAGLNSRIGARGATSLISVLPQVSSALAQIPTSQKFWTDTPDGDDLSTRPPVFTPAPAATPSVHQCMWHAYWLVDGAVGIAGPIAHKILHHKRPWLFPQMDRVTRKFYLSYDWQTIGHELRTQANEFVQLEDWFATLAGRQRALGDEDAVDLTRLRIHDILLWLEGKGQRQTAIGAGTTLLNQSGWVLNNGTWQ